MIAKLPDISRGGDRNLGDFGDGVLVGEAMHRLRVGQV
jgi:hypothetical protein